MDPARSTGRPGGFQILGNAQTGQLSNNAFRGRTVCALMRAGIDVFRARREWKMALFLTEQQEKEQEQRGKYLL